MKMKWKNKMQTIKEKTKLLCKVIMYKKNKNSIKIKINKTNFNINKEEIKVKVVNLTLINRKVVINLFGKTKYKKIIYLY